MGRVVRAGVVVALALVLGACGNSSFELPGVVVEGRVTWPDGPLPPTARVVAVPPAGRTPLATTIPDDAGRYRFDLENPNACAARIVAYIPGSPYPLESDPAIIAPNPQRDCTPAIEVRDVEIPSSISQLDSVWVRGTVTRAGSPATAVVTLVLVSYAAPSPAVAAAETDSVGGYELATAVPRYFCNNLEIMTAPAAGALLPVGGCSASLIDITLAN